MKKIRVALVAFVVLMAGCTETTQIVASSIVTQIVTSGIEAWIKILADGTG